MTLTPELLLAGASILTAIVTALASWRATRFAARKDEVQLLRDEVTRLGGRVKELDDEVGKYRRNESKLLEYVTRLRVLMLEAKISVPDMPVLE